MGGCVIAATYSPWEHAVVRRVLRRFEAPSPRVLAGAVPRQRLPALYPLTTLPQRWAVVRANAVCDRVPGQQSPALHVLRKVPWDAAAVHREACAPGAPAADTSPSSAASAITPPQPFFGAPAASAPPEAAQCGSADPVPDGVQRSRAEPELLPGPATATGAGAESPSAELAEVQREIAARKAWLSGQGLSATACKRDAVLKGLCRRQDWLHRDKLQDRLREREAARPHVSVLLQEAVEHLMALGPHGAYVDGTFGRGGHSAAILAALAPDGRLTAFDIDPVAVQVGRALERADPRFTILHAPFGALASAVAAPASGVLLDLGVSSPQLDEPARGFSVKARKDGPLDLRMDPYAGPAAAEWLAAADVSALAAVLQRTCHALEPPLHERVAEEIVEWQRRHGPFRSMQQFAAMLRGAEAELRVEHPTLRLPSLIKTSLRIFLNDEMPQLRQGLDAAFERLRPFGRCCVICFNRWEVAAIREFLRCTEEPSADVAGALPPERLAELYPLLASARAYAVRRVARPIRPTPEELARNQRAKSSLHVLEKVPRRSAAPRVPAPHMPAHGDG